MECVTLAGTQGLSWRLHRALAADGRRIATGLGIRILCGAGIPLAQVPDECDRLLKGGRLLLLGGEGPLLARLHLRPLPGRVVEGRASSFHEAFPEVRIRPSNPIHGVGYALLRVGDDVVALGGPRGAGFFVHLSETDPDPALFRAALQWLDEPRW